MSAKIKNFFPWLQMVGQLSTIVANRGGAAPDEIRYLNLIVGGVAHGTMTEADLAQLQEKVTHKIQTGDVPDNQYLKNLEDRLLSRSEEIQVDGAETVQERNARLKREEDNRAGIPTEENTRPAGPDDSTPLLGDRLVNEDGNPIQT